MQTIRANAKINLYLDVVSRRENGYHNIYSLMQTISLCDLVSIDFKPGEHTSIHLQAAGNDRMPLDSRNLAWRAAELYLQAADRSGEVRIYIEKHIPMAAGLAGGSTDAAAVLRGLNKLCGMPLTVEELCSLGARLGADVPFCIVGGCAIAEGIGERLTPNAGMPDCRLVVACMGDGVSTPWAYGELDKKFGDFKKARATLAGEALADMLSQSVTISRLCSSFYNIFEDVVPTVQPYVNKLKQTMEDHGAVKAMMSGSGPSVFGVFESDEAASNACEVLKKLGASAFVCYPSGAYAIK